MCGTPTARSQPASEIPHACTVKVTRELLTNLTNGISVPRCPSSGARVKGSGGWSMLSAPMGKAVCIPTQNIAGEIHIGYYFGEKMVQMP